MSRAQSNHHHTRSFWPVLRLLRSYGKSAILGSVLILGGGLNGCVEQTTQTQRSNLITVESQRLNDWFEARYQDELARSPMTRTFLGKTEGPNKAQDKLDDISQIALDENAALTRAWLEDMRRNFDIDRLDPQTHLSYYLYEFYAKDLLETHETAQNDYVFNHMSGPHTELPAFLINYHQVSTRQDALDYISRLKAVSHYLGQAEARARAQFDAGSHPPKFVYAKLSDAARNVISGAPFEDSDINSPLWADFLEKVDSVEGLSPIDVVALQDSARTALLSSVQPAYISLLSMFETQAETARDTDGVWALPNGPAYYEKRLKHFTTTNLSPEEIHDLGIAEVARIQAEMQGLMDQIGFNGTLKDFFTHLRTDPKFTYPNTPDGQDAYLTEATQVIDAMRAHLDALFQTQPKADLVVKRVEPFREDTAFGAFYESPALDGSRPGAYYVNLSDMSDQPKYLLQALAYHEGLPGHHMQIAIAQELEGLPKFRTLGGHTAYVEGWALYAEALPAELGLYTDPYRDFGRLSMELFRAARLVVDTGIHTFKWDREKAVQYYLDNLPNPEGDVRAEIDRYIVWPGQATAYKIGMLKIQELRRHAENHLGETFDIGTFHDVILANGSLPLAMLEIQVDDYITQRQAETPQP